MRITVACENPRCREFGVEYHLDVDSSFAGAHCHPCGVILGRNGYPYRGHRIPDDVMEQIRALPATAAEIAARKRAAALERLIAREIADTEPATSERR